MVISATTTEFANQYKVVDFDESIIKELEYVEDEIVIFDVKLFIETKYVDVRLYFLYFYQKLI